MKIDCFLVIGKKRGSEARVRRVAVRRPPLAADEALVRLQLEIPSDIFEAPLITVPIEKRSIAVAAEVDEPV